MFFYLLRLFSTLFPLPAHRVVRTQCLAAAGWVCCLHSNHQEQRLICTVSEQGWGAVCAHVCLRHCLALQRCAGRELSCCKPQTARSSHLVWLRAHRCWSPVPQGPSQAQESGQCSLAMLIHGIRDQHWEDRKWQPAFLKFLRNFDTVWYFDTGVPPERQGKPRDCSKYLSQMKWK